MNIDRIISSVRSTLTAEGLTPSKEAEEIGQKLLRGLITEDEAISMIKKLHGLE
jgi:hypothetical protein